MKKTLILATILSAISLNANAEETKEKSPLRANLKRVALDISSTEVKNADQYQNSPVSALNSDSKNDIKGVLDFTLEYEQEKYQWDNSIYAIYGKTKIKPTVGPDTETEDNDQLLLSSDIAYKMWKYDQADVGPFTMMQYETEFTANDNAPKTQIVRNKTGIKLFNGQYFSNLYIAGVTEYDMTYSENKTSKLAAEIGANAKFPLREGVDFEIEGYYRDYLSYSEYVGEDLKYDLNLVGRMNVKVVGNFAIAPFVSYRYAESRRADKAGSNFMTGISLSYADVYNIE